MTPYFTEICQRFKMDKNWPNLIRSLVLLRERERY